MNIVSPSIRITLGLTGIIISVLLLGSIIGLIPDGTILKLESRKNIVQSLTTQCMFAIRHNDVTTFEKIITDFANVTPGIRSMGLRNESGTYIAQTEKHKIFWVAPKNGKSTLTHWQVPLKKEDKLWATMEICFPPEKSNFLMGYRTTPFTIMLVFCGGLSFLLFLIYIKKTLRDLDPSKVMPSRVVYALNVLIEGVLLLDMEERIILANTAFAKIIGSTVESLLGLKASDLPWFEPDTNKQPTEYPWLQALLCGPQTAIRLNFMTKKGIMRNFVVSSVPIRNEKNKARGVIVTFDDVTNLEKKNIQLSEMLTALKKSRDKIQKQNKELIILATQDPLTGCLNRRAFFEKGRKAWIQASQSGGNIICVMADIDFFKSVNDTHGHSVGDQVIKFFAKTLISSVREKNDFVSRYGGEEFCAILENIDQDKAFEIVEQIRIHVMKKSPVSIKDAPGINVTVSFGISSSLLGANSLEELINQADQALYKAKETGRNRVICWA